MKKISHSFIYLISLLVILLCTGCKNEMQRNKSVVPENIVFVSFCDKELSSRAAAYMFEPEDLNQSNITSYGLSGTYEGSFEYDSEYTTLAYTTFDNYESLIQFTAGLVEGPWSFELYAYIDDVAVLKDSAYLTIDSSNPNVVFNLQPITTGSGEIVLDFSFTQSEVSKIIYNYIPLNTDNTLGEKTTDIEAEVADKKFYSGNTTFGCGKYVLFVKFYMKKIVEGSEVSYFMGQFTYLVVVETGRVTTVQQTFSDLTVTYELQLDLNDSTATAQLKGAIPSVIQCSSLSEIALPTNNSFTAKPSGKIFLGWNTKADGTGIRYTSIAAGIISGNLILYAEWGNEPCYTIVFKDAKKSFFSGTAMSGYSTSKPTLTEGAITIPAPGSFETNGLTLTEVDEANIPEFAGWYIDESCTIPFTKNGSDYTFDFSTAAAGTTYTSEISGSEKYLTVYAKWNYKVVYVDPGNATDDSASGITAANAVKSIAEAKRLTCNDSTTDRIYVMSRISEVTDLNEMSGTEAVYTLHSTNTVGMVYINTNTVFEFTDIVFDGNKDYACVKNTHFFNHAYNIKLTLNNVVFRNVTTDVSYYTFRSASEDLKLINCSFENSTSGMITTSNSSTLVIQNCTFSDVKNGSSWKVLNTSECSKFTMTGTTVKNCKNGDTLISIKGTSPTSEIKIGDFGEEKHNKFINNTSLYGGVCSSPYNTKYIYCDFDGNTANGYSAMYQMYLLGAGHYYNCLFSNNTFAQTDSGNLIYTKSSTSQLELQNCVFKDNTNTANDVFTDGINPVIGGACSFSNGIKLKDSYLSLGSDIAAVTGSTKVAQITMNTYTPGARVISDGAKKDLFSLSNPDYTIDDTGCLHIPYSAGGDIENPLEQDIYFTISAEEVSLSDSLIFSCVNRGNAASVNVSDWNITALYYAVESVPLTLDLSGDSSSKTINLADAGIQNKGTYVFTVSASYLGVVYSSEFTVTVK